MGGDNLKHPSGTQIFVISLLYFLRFSFVKSENKINTKKNLLSRSVSNVRLGMLIC